MMKRIAVLISNKGTGTNLQAIIDGINSRIIKATIVSVISDSKDAYGLERAKKANIKTIVLKNNDELAKILKDLKVDFVCLTGWKKIIPDSLIDNFRILNIHPGLIPDTKRGIVKNPDRTDGLWNKGKFTDIAIQNVLDSGTTYAGSTVHFLSKEFDFGPVLGRVFEKIKKGDTVESLYARLKKQENKLFVDVLSKLCSNFAVMIIDGGGRGAALVDKYGQSKKVEKILVVPGNDLMQINTTKKVLTFPGLKTTSVSEILEIAKKEKVDLVDVAQDNAVEAGVANEVEKIGVKVFGSTKEAGQIEWDKAWAREFMVKYKIPTPRYHIFHSQKEAEKFVKNNLNKAWFVKASGLAEGKGVIPGKDEEQTLEAIAQMSGFGNSGKTFLLEEWLEGEEFSGFAFCDGNNFKVVGYAQDHKRVNDGDLGPNTGGMGCVSNPLIVNENIKKQTEEIFQKVIEGMEKEGHPYKGVLYLGGMVVNDKVYIIEFNARWGDPEAEVILPSIKTDYLEIVDAVINGKLKDLNIEVDEQVRVVVAATAKGYPTDYAKVKGKKVLGIDKATKLCKIYGAGIKRQGRDWVVNGGRVLYVVGEGKDVLEAREKAYKAMALINIEGDNLHYRSDIGWRDMERLK